MNPSLARRLLFFGFLGVLLGFVIPLLIVLKLIESTLFINFLAFAVSVAGLFMGVIGTAMYVSNYRNKRDE